MYSGNQFKVTREAARIKHVECVECGEKYAYLMERKAIGKGSTVYWIDTDGAQDRAALRAQRELGRKLREECDLVPCPACGLVHPDMVRWAKRRHLRWLRALGVAVTTGAAVFGIANYLTASDYRGPYLMKWGTFVWLAFLGPALIGLRTVLAAAHDPNTGDRHELKRVGAERALSPDELEELRTEEKEAPRKRR